MENGKDFVPKTPLVHIEQLSAQEGHLLVGGMPEDLQGGTHFNHNLVIDVLAWLQEPGRTAYRLKWRGNKTPRGTEINGKEIVIASNDYIAGDPWGDDVWAKYKRVIREQKENSDDQEMIVLVPRPDEILEVR